MTPSELKYQHEAHYPESCFFDRSSMKFFGDTMRNYGVRLVTVENTETITGTDPYFNEPKTTTRHTSIEAWELYRRRPVKHGLQSSVYFDKDTFARIFPERS